MTSQSISVLVQNRHTVLIEGDATKPELRPYLNIGAYIINTKEELLDRGDLIVKTSCPDLAEIDNLSGKDKILFTEISLKKNETLIRKIIDQKISLFDYSQIKGLTKRFGPRTSRVEFSNFILPFLLELADKGLKALVEDEVLRNALMIMHGKVFNNELASLFHLPCHEF